MQSSSDGCNIANQRRLVLRPLRKAIDASKIGCADIRIAYAHIVEPLSAGNTHQMLMIVTFITNACRCTADCPASSLRNEIHCERGRIGGNHSKRDAEIIQSH